MAEYQDILRFLASNPPNHEPDKAMHASMLEMLARKLRGEDVKVDQEVLKTGKRVLNRNKKYH